MKKQIAMYAALIFIAIGLTRMMGQSFQVQPSGVTLAQCQTSQPPAVNSLLFCNVANDGANPAGLYVSANAAAYFLVSKSGTGGVATFNNRSGNVLPAQDDYTYSQLKSKPTTISCATSSQSNTGFTASGCVIQ